MALVRACPALGELLISTVAQCEYIKAYIKSVSKV